MSEFLICIENVKTDLKNEMLYHMYSNNTCEAEKPYDVLRKRSIVVLICFGML